MEITYRLASPEDFDFLYQLHRAAMLEQVEDSYGPWDEQWQLVYFRKHFEPHLLQIIQADGIDAGVLYVQDRAEERFIVRIEILPAYQRRGIGAAVIRAQVDLARSRGKPVALQVLKTNIAARSLYQRLGFGVTGENDTHYIMACK
jgi:ribosomal protein S18 acetylase RimI-like enzyme